MSAIINSSEIFYSPAIQAVFKIDPYSLQAKWQKSRLDYDQLVSAALEENLDISQQRDKMQQIIHDQPKLNENHQFVHIRVLYETRMYERYNKEIRRMIAQNSLFYKNKEALHKDLKEQLKQVEFKFQEWCDRANKKNVNVFPWIVKMQEVITHQPSLHELHQVPSVRVLYEIKMYTMYCIQIIRQIAENEIHCLATTARSTDGLKNESEIIRRSEEFLLNHLPSEERKSFSNLSIEQAEQKYHFIQEQMQEMTSKISKKVRASRKT